MLYAWGILNAGVPKVHSVAVGQEYKSIIPVQLSSQLWVMNGKLTLDIQCAQYLSRSVITKRKKVFWILWNIAKCWNLKKTFPPRKVYICGWVVQNYFIKLSMTSVMCTAVQIVVKSVASWPWRLFRPYANDCFVLGGYAWDWTSFISWFH